MENLNWCKICMICSNLFDGLNAPLIGYNALVYIEMIEIKLIFKSIA